MSESPALLYLEADDEITAVVRRVRSADASRVVIVAPGRSGATSSAVALRLLARAGEESGRELAIVGDVLTRSLAAEAGLPAFATVDEARRGEPGAPTPAAEPRHATINIVRGAASDDTVAAPIAAGSDDLTRAVPVTPRPRPGKRRRSRRTAGVGILAGLAAVLLVGFVAGAAILPAATITIVPRIEEVGPVSYVVEIEDPERLRGTMEASTTVTATGTYEILEPATGTVVLFNWTFAPVSVPAETLVAAGLQAFRTQVDVVVPPGSLTPGGTIAAGDESVAVEAAAVGPEANVGPDEINVVLDEGVDAQLRGFAGTPPRVLNPEATSGGRDESGIKFAQADVDAAVERLQEDLSRQVADAIAELGDAIVVQPDAAEPAIEGADELVGARDEAEATLDASLAWEALAADRGEVAEAARRQLVDDPRPVAEGQVLLADSIQVAVEGANVVGGTMRVDVTATGRSAAEVDRAEVLERAVGRTPDEAEAALADLGQATVELWPGWVGTVPATEWRVDLRLPDH